MCTDVSHALSRYAVLYVLSPSRIVSSPPLGGGPPLGRRAVPRVGLLGGGPPVPAASLRGGLPHASAGRWGDVGGRVLQHIASQLEYHFVASMHPCPTTLLCIHT